MKTAIKIIKNCIPFIIALGLVFVMLTAAGNLQGGSKTEEKEHLEDALRRAALSCYASQGYYPPDLEYITSRYGIQIDTDSFAVFYTVFAENIMPDIDVVVRHE